MTRPPLGGGLLPGETDSPSAPGPRAPRPGRWRARMVVAAALVVVVAVLAIGLGAISGSLNSRLLQRLGFPAPDYSGTGTGTVTVQIAAQESVAAIGTSLVTDGVVRSQQAFIDAASGDTSRLTPGFFLLRHHMSARAAVARLLDPAARVQSRVTVPEGRTVAQTLTLIAQQTTVPLVDLQAAAAAPAALGLPSYAGGSLEGYLFPATYDVPPGTSATAVLKMMVGRFVQEATADHLVSGAAALGLTPQQVVIIASLIEKEAALPADRPKVARVVINHLRASDPALRYLRFDSTVNFALARPKGNLSNADTRTPSPYNTYLHPGLPPGPIADPGAAALNAALNPTPGDFLYFITLEKENRTVFTSSYSAFLAAKAIRDREDGLK